MHSSSQSFSNFITASLHLLRSYNNFGGVIIVTGVPPAVKHSRQSKPTAGSQAKIKIACLSNGL